MVAAGKHSRLPFSKDEESVRRSHLQLLIDVPAMADAQDPHLIFNDLEDNAIIADSQFPIPFQSFPKGFAVGVR